MRSYKDLDIYKKSFDLAIAVHRLTLSLPNHEKYEIGSQLRRSNQSIKDNIIEGYGRRSSKKEFIRYLTFSYASLLETKSQLEMLKELYYPKGCQQLIENYIKLGKMINSFISYFKNHWKQNRPISK